MPLAIDDFVNPLFNVGKPQLVEVINRGFKHKVIEGVTFSDNFHKIAFSYYVSTGIVSLHYFDEQKQKNVFLLEKKIYSKEDFEDAVSKADRRIYKYFVKN